MESRNAPQILKLGIKKSPCVLRDDAFFCVGLPTIGKVQTYVFIVEELLPLLLPLFYGADVPRGHIASSLPSIY